MKTKIVIQPEQFSSFTSWYLESLWHEYFDIEIYDAHTTYNAQTLFVFWWMNVNDTIVERLCAQGHKIVIDNLWEMPAWKFDKFYQLNNPNWCWYNESLWWRALGYHQYRPVKTYEKLALMPIRRTSAIRDWIVKELKSKLDQFVWSYRDQKLPNDNLIDNGADVNQRYMCPDWFNNTCISLVVESNQFGTCWWPTDKTYKACAYYHPFLIIGQSNTLQILKSQGFETFSDIFDESYDQEPDFEKRFELVRNNIDQFVAEPYSDYTWQKLQHNHNHFFDEALCKQRIVKEIIEPLLHYAET